MLAGLSRFTLHVSWLTARASRFTLWATAVLLIAAVFRLVSLLDVPPGLAQDEVLDADIAAFIRGGYHAFFFREGYGHEPLYHYLATPFAPLLGDNMLAVRLPSVILGMLLVALTMRWAKREFGGLTAVVAGLGLAISWWPIIFSRIGIRPILLPVLLLLTIWFWKRPLLAGLFLGLSFYSYTAARIIFLLPLGYALAQRLAGQRRIGGLTWWHWLLLTLASFALIAAPMQITLWRDPSLQQRIDQLAGPLEALRAGDPGPIGESVLRTLGVFSFVGDPRWTYTLPNRPLFDWVTALFFYLGLGLAVWRWRDTRMALLLVWLAVGLIPSAVTPQAPSTVRLTGAMPVVYLLLGLSGAWLWQNLGARGWQLGFGRWGLGVGEGRLTAELYRVFFIIILLALALGNGARTVRDGFILWPQARETRLNHYQAVLLDMSRHLRANPTKAPVVADSFFEPIDHDSLRRSLGETLAVRWVQTGAGLAGALVLPAGVSDGRMLVPEYAPISPDLLAAAGIASEPLYRSPTFPSFAVYPLSEIKVTASATPLAVFAERLSLIDYEILQVTPDEPLRLLTWWRVERPLPADLAAFVHLSDAEGVVMTQHDGWDAAAETLRPGDVIIQRHTLLVPEYLSSGEYSLFLGLYERENERRWPLTGSNADNIMLQLLLIDGN